VADRCGSSSTVGRPNPCSEEIVIPAFGVKRFLPTNETTAVEFTPNVPGTFDFSCGMGMLHGRIVVEA